MLQIGLLNACLADERFPLRQSGGAAFLESLSINDVTFEIKMVVNIGVD